ncbi:MAG: SDR family NAD(P)-dependent oxidoreductase [Actinomycetota bacterium]|nr:SDR family NAD(P)-dependent oxidoreductase [Actinomycetota bacterium]
MPEIPADVSPDKPSPSIENEIVVITGASAGIGAAAAIALAHRGARLAIVGRSPTKTAEIAKRTGGRAFVADFARLGEVRRLGEELLDSYPRIDILANNAGLLARRRELTEDGHELTFQVNHLAPFLLTNLLIEHLGPGSRVITTSSRAQHIGRIDRLDLESTRRYFGLQVYGTTKLENVLFSNELARRMAPRGISSVAFHPGTVRSEFGRRGGLMVELFYKSPLRHVFMISPEEGADTLVWLATAPEGEGWSSGGYYAKRQPAPTARQAHDSALASWLWAHSAEVVGLQ